MIFYHSGKAIAKKRHRISNKKTYDPQNSEKLKMKWMFASQFRNQGYLNPLKGAIAAQVDIYLPFPKSWPKKAKKMRKYKISRPDIDNYQKFYFDVLNKIAYEDDSQIALVLSQKIYSENPGVKITLIPIEEENKVEMENENIFLNKRGG